VRLGWCSFRAAAQTQVIFCEIHLLFLRKGPAVPTYKPILHSKKFNNVRIYLKQTNKLRGLSPHANYTDRAAAAGRRS